MLYLLPEGYSQWVIFAAGEGSLLGDLGGSELDWGVPPATLQPVLSSLAPSPTLHPRQDPVSQRQPWLRDVLTQA